MQTWILWLLALYGLTVLWVQFRQWLHYPQEKQDVHYYVFTENSQGQIECIIRYLSRFAKLEGRSFHFYILDTGSEDDTLKIVERMKKNGIEIHLIDTMPLDTRGSNDKMKISVDLRERCYSCEFRTT
jgi:hypothetical protein